MGALTDWTSSEIKQSGNEFELTNLPDWNDKSKRTETRLFSAACPGYALVTQKNFNAIISFFDFVLKNQISICIYKFRLHIMTHPTQLYNSLLVVL